MWSVLRTREFMWTAINRALASAFIVTLPAAILTFNNAGWRF